jgi:3-deoxy-manno-octulosonate cytidylyltransferase (CMP-KDO synthetase)
MNQKIIGLIPARMASSRFPGKPLAPIHGVPTVGHVYHRCKMSFLLAEVYVATCDREIYDYITGIGGQAVMTLDSHERCSDRTAEAMLKIEAATGQQVDIVVMVQGDEPMVTPGMIEVAVNPMLADPGIQVVNLMAPMRTLAEFEDPNEVKVVVSLDGSALYFSREPIPSRKKGVADVPMLRQVGIIPFRRDYLLRFNDLPPTPLEQIESVDMLRIIEHGERVHMVMTEAQTVAVDTPGDLARVVELMRDDPLRGRY